jgi:hypothetical protein
LIKRRFLERLLDIIKILFGVFNFERLDPPLVFVADMCLV